MALSAVCAVPAVADPIKNVLTVHGATSNEFWQPVKKGFEDAWGKVQADCQMLFTSTNGSIEQQAANMEAGLAGNPDALITTIADYMSVARNLFIGREPLRISIVGLGVMDLPKMRWEAVKDIADVDLHLRSPDALVGELSGGQRQGFAIARAMHFRSKVLILDEPTNHLSVRETEKVLRFVRLLGAQGMTCIFISHNLHHVFSSCERVVAMARGEIMLDKVRDQTSIKEVQEVL